MVMTPTENPRVHLLRGFVQWTNRQSGKPIKTIAEANEWVREVAAWGFDRFYTWSARRPRRTKELEGSSVFFVGGVRRSQTLFRMPLLDIEESDEGVAICMRPKLIRVEPHFVGRVRGWRYLSAANAPADMAHREPAGDDVPEDLARAIDELGA